MDEHATFDLIPTCRRCQVFAQLEELTTAEVDTLVRRARNMGFIVRPLGTMDFEIRCTECRSEPVVRRAIRRVIVPLVQPQLRSGRWPISCGAPTR